MEEFAINNVVADKDKVLVSIHMFSTLLEDSVLDRPISSRS